MFPAERLKGIENFVATADAGSFTAAAERLNLTSSAVSKSVARLEDRLHTRLFERTTRRLALTDAGAAFYRTCVTVLADLEEAEAVLAAQRSEPIGRLRMDAPATFGRLRVWPLMLQFARQHPNLRPHVSFTDRFVDLADEGIDIAVRIGGPDHWPGTVGHRFLGREHLVFCASPDYLAQRGTPSLPAELVQCDAVLYGKADGTTSPWLITHGPGAVERKVMESRLTVGDGEAQVAAVKAGYGVAQLATWMICDEMARGELVQVLPELATEGLSLNLVWPIGRQLLPKVDAMLELLSADLSIA